MARMVNKQIVKVLAEIRNYEGNKLVGTRKEEIIGNPDHWKKWAKSDRNMGASATVRTTFHYGSHWSGDLLDSYTTRKNDNKVVYKVIGEPKPTGQYRMFPE